MAIKRILIVDDSPTERHVLNDMLTKAGYEVVAVIAGDDLVAGLGQHVVQHVPLGRRIVDDQNALDSHRVPPLAPRLRATLLERPRLVQFDCCAVAFTWVATALSRLSLVKGLVRYWSEPTMRPRARSN